MKLWPSKKQWQNWKLPSKLTAVGTFLAVISLFVTLALYVGDKVFADDTDVLVSEVQKLKDGLKQITIYKNSTRDEAYFFAWVNAVGDLTEAIEDSIAVSQQSIESLLSDPHPFNSTFEQKITSVAHQAWGGRLDVEVMQRSITSELSFSDGRVHDPFNSQFDKTISIVFLHANQNEDLPDTLKVSYHEIETADTTSFEVEVTPDLSKFSIASMLMEFNLAGFYVQSVDTLGQNGYFMHIVNRANGNKAIGYFSVEG